MNIASHILLRGDDAAPAILHGNVSVSYADLRSAVTRIACNLLEQGFRHGTRVGLVSENSPFFVSAYLGIIRAGLVVVPFQTDMSQAAFAQIVKDAGIEAVVISRRHAARLKTWTDLLGIQAIIEPGNGTGMPRIETEFPAVEPARDLAALMFTSGSTGAPKGVMVTHRNIECNSGDIINYMGLAAEDRVMVVLPFHYCFGLSLLHTHLAVGGTLVLNNQFLYPEKVLEDMVARECTGIAGVPSTYQILLRKSRFKQMRFPALRWLQQAGGKLHNAYIREIIETFPEVRYYLMYGQTEATARLSFLPPERLADKLGSIGRGLPSTRLEVLNSDGLPVTPGSDEVGEIVASGDNISPGYWNDGGETANYFRNRKLYTGDLARVDGDGFIFIVERDREMIKSGGNRVSAKEVEDVIAELPAIVEVAVIGVPHEVLGEAIKAFVVLAGEASLTASEITDYCRRKLPGFKCPESLEILDVLPHTSSGKVAKRTLKEMHTAGLCANPV